MRSLIIVLLVFANAAWGQTAHDTRQSTRDLDPELGPGVFRDCAVCPEMKQLGDFAIGRFEVTRDQYGEFLRATGRIGRNAPAACASFPQREDHPAVCVTKDLAAAYAVWLSQITGKAYVLPTAAQWERAAGKVAVSSPPKTAPAGMSEPNVNGLYDMAGNASELTQDGVRGGADRLEITGFRVASETK